MTADAQSVDRPNLPPTTNGVDDLVVPYDSPLVDFSKIDYSKVGFDFMRCGKCGRLCTKPELERMLDRGTGACPCGALKYYPVNFKRHYLKYPRVWWFAILRLLRLA